MPNPIRRWTRFSVRTRLLVVLLISIWLGLAVRGALKQQRITDAGLAVLTGKKHLKRLTLRDITLDANGLEHLRNCTVLTDINLAGSRISDEALSPLADMIAIEHLRLDYTNLTDRGLENLKGPLTLSHLNLRGTRITDEGMIHLQALPRLDRVDVANTAVTNEGTEGLIKVLPKCRVVR